MARFTLKGMPYRILVCGSRKFPYKHRQEIYKIIDNHVDFYEPDMYGNTLPKCCIISGEATGVDSLATEYAIINWTAYEGFPADWGMYGRKAGPMRNQDMIDSKPDLVLAINPGVGTKDTIRRAKKANIPVIIYEITIDNDTEECYTRCIE